MREFEKLAKKAELARLSKKLKLSALNVSPDRDNVYAEATNYLTKLAPISGKSTRYRSDKLDNSNKRLSIDEAKLSHKIRDNIGSIYSSN